MGPPGTFALASRCLPHLLRGDPPPSPPQQPRRREEEDDDRMVEQRQRRPRQPRLAETLGQPGPHLLPPPRLPHPLLPPPTPQTLPPLLSHRSDPLTLSLQLKAGVIVD